MRLTSNSSLLRQKTAPTANHDAGDATPEIMKTMLELLIRLQEMRCCCERTRRNPQLTSGEKAVACSHKLLVRECLPADLLTHYDRMKKRERAMLACPEVFAMAVLVSTWRSLPPARRRKLVAHFATQAPTVAKGKALPPNHPVRVARNGPRRYKTVDGDVVGEPWPH